MKVGDLVMNGQRNTGIVIGFGHGSCNSYDICPFPNPDIQVLTAYGKKHWSYNALEVISEKR